MTTVLVLVSGAGVAAGASDQRQDKSQINTITSVIKVVLHQSIARRFSSGSWRNFSM